MTERCDYCGRDVELTDWYCPHCGANGPAKKKFLETKEKKVNSQINENYSSNHSNSNAGLVNQPQQNSFYKNPNVQSASVNQPQQNSFYNTQYVQPNTTVSPSQQTTANQNIAKGDENIGMNWHVLVFFSLAFGFLTNTFLSFRVFQGIDWFQGMSRTEALLNIKILYSHFPILRPFDILCGILYLGTSIFQGLTAYKLFKYKKNAPQHLTYVYLLLIGCPIFRNVFGAMIMNVSVELVFAELISNTIIYGLLLLINRKYYQKRAFLFDQ